MRDFWSRRRKAVADEERAEVEAAAAEEQAVAQAALEARSDEELLAELGLPEPETLVGGEELQRFLAAQLPQRLKRRALRALWRSNPVLACLDGLNDYEDDFTDAAVVKEGVQTLYQVGRGFLAQVQEAADQLPEAAPEPEAASLPETSVRQPEPQPAPLPEPPTQIAALDDTHSHPEEEPATETLPPRFRRMQFQFDTERPA